MFAWGISAGIGVYVGGGLSDRLGPSRVIVPSVMIIGLAFVSLSFYGHLAPVQALWPSLIALMVWAFYHWGFYPAQQARLIELAGVNVASIVLSLNASFMYIGFSIGAAVGGLTIATRSIGDLGTVAGLFEFASVALTLTVLALRRVRGSFARGV
jgi:predicted MFS family arabinose efflux permease